MKYENPSIVEALCEFTFAPETPWDPTIFGRLYERVKENFPNIEEGEMLTATLTMNPQATQALSAPQLQRTQRMVFSNNKRKQLIQIAQRVLTINVLAPYPGWEEFRPMILATMNAYRSITEIAEADQVSLRYLDRFEYDKEGFRLGDWLSCDGSLFPQELADQSLATYQMRHPRVGGEHFALTAVCGPASDKPAAHNLILDTHIIRTGPIAMGEESKPVLEAMHHQIINAFERSITPQLRERLGPVPINSGVRQ